jgi:Eukaryotic glutathione synthase, ATP binding domain
VSLGLIRSDIMLESACFGQECAPECSTLKTGPYCCWKQVEINTIASGFGWLGPASGQIHRYSERVLLVLFLPACNTCYGFFQLQLYDLHFVCDSFIQKQNNNFHGNHRMLSCAVNLTLSRIYA